MSRSREADLARIDRIATMLDSRFRIPGTGIRFGWDGILGLIPGVGDIVAFAPAAYLVFEGWRMGVRRRALARMALNSGLDFVIGGVPILGDVFDVAFKANNRNAAILRREVERRPDAAEARAEKRSG